MQIYSSSNRSENFKDILRGFTRSLFWTDDAIASSLEKNVESLEFFQLQTKYQFNIFCKILSKIYISTNKWVLETDLFLKIL